MLKTAVKIIGGIIIKATNLTIDSGMSNIASDGLIFERDK
jgi:hypothetical protein